MFGGTINSIALVQPAMLAHCQRRDLSLCGRPADVAHPRLRGRWAEGQGRRQHRIHPEERAKPLAICEYPFVVSFCLMFPRGTAMYCCCRLRRTPTVHVEVGESEPYSRLAQSLSARALQLHVCFVLSGAISCSVIFSVFIFSTFLHVRIRFTPIIMFLKL